ncbi:MAG TPA: endolytic transglycosylase MltG, partial [Patescibacteria group bacterium]|nr:endolytic transglycosylase MltG [Patescibacteria group bacterium]
MKRPLIILAAVFGTLALLAWTGAWLSTPSTKGAASFAVAKGEGTEAIVRHLKEQGIIRSELFFKLALSNSGLATKLQPGTYDFRGAADFAEIIRRLASGGVPANEFVLLVKEGWNLSDVRDALAAAGYAQADKLFFVTGLPATDHRTLSADGAPKPADFSADFPFLKDKPPYVSLEGFLFPDTYRLFRDATPEDVVKTML